MSVGQDNREDALTTLRWAIAQVETVQIDAQRLETMIRTALRLLEQLQVVGPPASPVAPSIPD